MEESRIKNFIINYFLGLVAYALVSISLVYFSEPNDMTIDILSLGILYFFVVTFFIHLISKFLKSDLSQNQAKVMLINITIILLLILFNRTDAMFSLTLAVPIILVYNFIDIKIKNKYLSFLGDFIVNFFIILGVYSLLALFMTSIMNEEITDNPIHNVIGFTIASTIILVNIKYILIIIIPSLYLSAYFINKKILEKNYILDLSLITIAIMYLMTAILEIITANFNFKFGFFIKIIFYTANIFTIIIYSKSTKPKA